MWEEKTQDTTWNLTAQERGGKGGKRGGKGDVFRLFRSPSGPESVLSSMESSTFDARVRSNFFFFGQYDCLFL